MIERRLFNHLAAAAHGRLKMRHCFSLGGYWDPKCVAGIMMTCLAITLRGLLVTTAAVGIVDYLLLTRSHL